MALSQTQKKGGVSRQTLLGISGFETGVVIPEGFRVRAVSTSVSLPPQRGTINLQTVTVGGTPAAGTVIIDGTTVVTTAAADAVGLVAARIVAASPFVGATSGQTWYAYSTGSAGLVFYTKPVPGSRATTTALTITGTGGYTGTATSVGGTANTPFYGTPTLSAGTVAIGSSFPSIPIHSFSITGAATTGGVFVVDGVQILIPGSSSIDAIGAIMVATSFAGATNGPWVASFNATTDTVTLTGLLPANANSGTGITVTVGSTGITVGSSTATVVNAGVAAVTNVVNAQSLPTTVMGASDLTVASTAPRSAVALDAQQITVGGSASAGQVISVGGKYYTLVSGDVSSTTTLAAAIVAQLNSIPGYYATNSSAVITLYVTDSQKQIPVVAVGTATSMTLTKVTYPQDQTLWLSLGASTKGYLTLGVVGNVNVYVQLEKFS